MPTLHVRNRLGEEEILADRERRKVVDPWTGETVCEVDLATSRDLDRALARAHQVQPELRAMPRHARAAALLNIAALLRNDTERLAWDITRSMGKPIRFARGEVARAVITFTLAAEECKRFGGEVIPLDISPAGEGTKCLVERFPQGPVAAITPFNFPLNLAAHKVAPALAVGCPVILKPPPQAPTLGMELAKFAAEAGFPPGSLSALNLPVTESQRLATHPLIRHTSFTGSSAVGWKIRGACVTQRVTLEMGGNAAAVVHSDADLDWAVERCALGSFAASGQVCIKVQRILVHAAIFEDFLGRFVNAAEGTPGPDPTDPRSTFGPMIDSTNAGRVMDWLDQARKQGARLRCGGEREGNVIYPTVLTGVSPGTKVRDEEVFGPVTVVEPYAEFEEALAQVNDSVYGLQAGIFTQDVDRAFKAHRELEVGGVVVNDYPTFRVDNFPYGGVKSSGVGREGVRSAMEAFSEPRVLVIRLRD
jgi:acyl-CoA reductase-like NAD-dependent aldehyde dehydrogenase